jgi:tol-pal system protein YbgF
MNTLLSRLRLIRAPLLVLALAFTQSISAAPAGAWPSDWTGVAGPDPGISPAQAADEPDVAPGGPDPAALSVRIDRLERELRQMTGLNEELQHRVQTLEEQLRAARAAEPTRPAAPVAPAAAPAAPGAPAVEPAPKPARRTDAFDPAAAPGAPGAPKPLGATTPSAPVSDMQKPVAAPARDPGAPLDIAHGRLLGDRSAATQGEADTPVGAAILPSAPKDEFEEGNALLRAGKYESAEKTLAAFLAKNPKSRQAAAATYSLGESFFLRGRHREAAEKYLEISTRYAQATQAPDALLRLGQSLGAMGAKEQACAAFAEIGAKYPAAVGRLKDPIDREKRKAGC